MNSLLIGPIADLLKNLIGRVLPDPQAQADATFKMAQLIQSGELATMTADMQIALAQIGVNNTEAGSTDAFRAGWRPFVGWVCGSALAWNYILRPAAVAGAAFAGHPVALPSAEMGELMPLLMGLLGLGALRTVEKVKGAS